MRTLPIVLLSMALTAAHFGVARAAGADQEVIADSYASPGQLLEIGDGRELNVRCSGEGEPVVVLEAGGNADSSTWYRVQPRLARLTRVCSYDRAGYGFSGEGPYPRDLAADVADLQALIRAADFPLPVLLVGHSLGSNIVRSYAQLHPAAVAGLVLVDPSEQGADDRMPQEWQAQVAAMVAQRDEVLHACLQAAVAGDMDTIEQRCLRAPPSWMSGAVAAALTRNKAKPSYWRTLRSELASNIVVFSKPVPEDETYGDIPVLMLAAAAQVQDVPDEVRTQIEFARSQTHARILAASTRATAIDVPDASHDIQLDQPQAIVAAVGMLLDPAAQSRR